MELEFIRSDIDTILQLRKELSTIHEGLFVGGDTFSRLVSLWVRSATIASRHNVDIGNADFSSKDRIVIIASMKSKVELLDELLAQLRAHHSQRETELIIEAAAAAHPKLPEFSDALSDVLRISDAGRQNIHSKIDELRRLIDKAVWTSDDHKQRVMQRLAKLQGEVEKPVTSFERVIGGVILIGDAIGTFAKKADPAVEQAERLLLALRGEKKSQNALEKDKDPLQIPDLRDTEK